MIKRILLLLLVIIICGQLQAQDISDTSLTIETIEITNKRISTKIGEETRAIKIITKEDIEILPVQNVPELLQFVAGLDIRRRGINGVQADISMRGGTFDQILVMVNGVKMSDPQTGHHTANLPFSMDEIERIEVIKGPASRLYGQNAFSGVVNIITKVIDERNIKVGASYGSFQTNAQNLSINLPINNYNQKISLSRESSDGYDYNRDYSVNNAFYQSQLKLGDVNRLDFFSGFTERKFGANGFYASPDYVDQYEEIQTAITSLSGTFVSSDWVIKPAVNWRRNQDIYLFLRDNPGFFRNRHINNRIESTVDASYNSKIGTSGFGISLASESIRSSNLGDHDRSIFGLSLEHKFRLLNDKLDIHPGVLINKFSDEKFKLFPGIDAAYHVSDRFNFYSAINYSNRVPTYTDLYYSSPIEQGNPNLGSESSLSYEVGMKYRTSSFIGGVSVYKNIGSNLIDWVKDDINQEKWQSENFNKIIMKGVEIEADFGLNEFLEIENIIRLKTSMSFIDGNLGESVENRVLRYQFNQLGTQIISGVDFGFLNNNLVANIYHRKVGRKGAESDPLLSYQLVDAGLTYKYKDLNIKASLNNIANVEYKETNLVTMPGRWFSLGLRYKLGF